MCSTIQTYSDSGALPSFREWQTSGWNKKITRGFTQQSVARIPAGVIGCSQVLHLSTFNSIHLCQVQLQAATFSMGGT
jgi:hypothetical protein